MLSLLARITFGTVEYILIAIISMVELLIVIRVVCDWLLRLDIMRENRFSATVFALSEPILSPIRGFIMRLTGALSIDLSPLAALLLCELLSWLVRLIF